MLTLSSSQAITALTLVAPSGQTILAPITTLGAASPATWQYVAGVEKWFMV
jgi:hypothetical protein